MVETGSHRSGHSIHSGCHRCFHPIHPYQRLESLLKSCASLHLERPATFEDITALSCVVRAGRKDTATDHDSILFDVDVKTGSIGTGWACKKYLLPGRCPWRSIHPWTHSPSRWSNSYIRKYCSGHSWHVGFGGNQTLKNVARRTLCGMGRCPQC
jgi:hypothetical protein